MLTTIDFFTSSSSFPQTLSLILFFPLSLVVLTLLKQPSLFIQQPLPSLLYAKVLVLTPPVPLSLSPSLSTPSSSFATLTLLLWISPPHAPPHLTLSLGLSISLNYQIHLPPPRHPTSLPIATLLLHTLPHRGIVLQLHPHSHVLILSTYELYAKARSSMYEWNIHMF